MLLSVIIPVYNAAPWLDGCVRSILASLPDPQCTELILVDDGSTDDSGAICDCLAAAHANIAAYHIPHAGVAAARNAGLSHARGDYLAWVDPDDLVTPDWYDEIAAAAQLSPDVIVMDTLRFGAGAEQAEVYGRAAGFVDRNLFLTDLYRDIRMLSGLPNKVMRSSLFENVQFDPALPILEDFDAMPRILARAATVYYIPKCLYRYRRHESSLLHQVTAERAYLSFEIACRRAKNAEKNFRSAARTAACLQALAFLQNHHLIPDFSAKGSQIRTCTTYLRSNLSRVLCDGEVPLRTKAKLLLAACGLPPTLKSHKKGG